MKRGFYIIGALIAFSALYFVFTPNPISVETLKIQTETFHETLTSEGKIRARDKHIVYAFANGNLSVLQVKLGDSVLAKQEVALLDWDKEVKVTSPISGVVTKIYRDSAGPIQRGEPIFEVSDIGKLEVVVELLTTEAVNLSIGGEAKILNWGGPGELPAKIFHISKAGLIKTSALGVEEERTEVKLGFSEIPNSLKDKLGDNYHVDVLFQISQELNVLTAPLGSLFRIGDQWAVFKVADGRARTQLILFSKKNDRMALVTHGLKEGDEVILFPGDKIKEGIRIRVSK